MSSELERRLTALESKSQLGQQRVQAIIRTIVDPDSAGLCMTGLTALVNLDTGWRVDRDHNEAADAFIDRAIALAPRSSGGIVRLVEAVS